MRVYTFVQKLGGYTLCNVFIVLGMFFRTYILADQLNLEDFGKVFICVNFYTVIRLFIRPGVLHTLQFYVPLYEKEAKYCQLSSLLWLCLYLSIGVACVVLSIALFLTNWVADAWYHDVTLSSSLQLLGIACSFYMLGDISSILLRVKGQFVLSMVPSLIGAWAVPTVLLGYSHVGLTVESVIVVFAVGELLSISAVAILLFIYTRKQWSGGRGVFLLKPLRYELKELRKTLLQTSLFGLLRSSSDQVSTLLVGVFSGAKELALMAMAMQLAKPITVLQATVGNYLAPIISDKYTSHKYEEVLSILKKSVICGLICLILGLLFSVLVGRELIVLFLSNEYLEALPVFYVLSSAYMLVVMFSGFLPIAVAEGKMEKRNWVVCLRFVYLGIALCLGINAMIAAVVQILGALTTRIFNDLPLYKMVKKSAV